MMWLCQNCNFSCSKINNNYDSVIAGITGKNYIIIIIATILYTIWSVLALRSQKLITGTAQDVFQLLLVLHNFDPIDNL